MASAISFQCVYAIQTDVKIACPIAIVPEFTKEYVIWGDTTSNYFIQKFSNVFLDNIEGLRCLSSSLPDKIVVIASGQSKYTLQKMTVKIYEEYFKQFSLRGSTENFINDEELQNYFLKT